MNIRAFIFDCVGPLLIRDSRVIFDQETEIINHLCGKVTDEKGFWDSLKITYKMDEAKLTALINILGRGFVRNVPMWNFLIEIKKKYKTGLINNGTSAIFSRWNKKYSFQNYFDEVLNSSNLGIKKPDKKIYLYMSNLLLVKPEECLFIDNSIENIEGARQVGMSAILYNPNDHRKFLDKVKVYMEKYD